MDNKTQQEFEKSRDRISDSIKEAEANFKKYNSEPPSGTKAAMGCLLALIFFCLIIGGLFYIHPALGVIGIIGLCFGGGRR